MESRILKGESGAITAKYRNCHTNCMLKLHVSFLTVQFFLKKMFIEVNAFLISAFRWHLGILLLQR